MHKSLFKWWGGKGNQWSDNLTRSSAADPEGFHDRFLGIPCTDSQCELAMVKHFHIFGFQLDFFVL